MPGVLDGVRVLELGQVLAAPFAGAILADLGAEVVKVERVEGGDDARRMGPAFRQGDALNFHIFNRGKQSVALDLKSEAGRAHLDRLAAQADIFIHNLRPGVPKALGIDGETLCARHPRLIYGEISAFGAAGPMAMRPGYEPLLQYGRSILKDKIIFGSSFPMMSPVDAIAEVDGLGLDADIRQKWLHDNAARFLKLDSEARG